MKKVIKLMSAVAVVAGAFAPCALLAGNWTFDSSAKTFTSEDGEWEFTVTSYNTGGKRIYVSTCTKSAADGILDLRDVHVSGGGFNNVVITKFQAAPGASAPWLGVREFYCDCVDTVIGAYLFQGNTILTKVEVSGNANQLVQIGDYAFAGCTSLQSITISGQKPTKFKQHCFDGCSALIADVADIVPQNATDINQNAFQGCSGITGCLVLNNVGSTLNGSIFQNTGIQELRLCSDSLQSIRQRNCFSGCTSLTNVVISSTGLTRIDQSNTQVFYGDTALRTVTINAPNINTMNNSGRMFDGCANIKEVTILNEPWKDSGGNDITEKILSSEILYSVPAVSAETDAPKSCTVYAFKKDWRPYASPMEGSYERSYAPARCYGVYNASTGSAGRKAYMAQLPDYWPGFIISVD